MFEDQVLVSLSSPKVNHENTAAWVSDICVHVHKLRGRAHWIYVCILKKSRKIQKKKKFEVWPYYRTLDPRKVETLPWKSIRKPTVSTIVAFFLSAASLGKILTMDNLRKSDIILMSWCCMYKGAEETVDHLLLHCPTAREWSLHFVGFSGWCNSEIWNPILIIWCGAFGGREMTETLKGMRS